MTTRVVGQACYCSGVSVVRWRRYKSMEEVYSYNACFYLRVLLGIRLVGCRSVSSQLSIPTTDRVSNLQIQKYPHTRASLIDIIDQSSASTPSPLSPSHPSHLSPSPNFQNPVGPAGP